jgi:hypothetical protein
MNNNEIYKLILEKAKEIIQLMENFECEDYKQSCESCPFFRAHEWGCLKEETVRYLESKLIV